MCNCCSEESCSRPGVVLCEGPLRLFILESVSDVLGLESKLDRDDFDVNEEGD